MAENNQSPLNDYDFASCLIRFFSAAIFGLFVDIVILTFYGIILLMGYSVSVKPLLYTLATTPLIWGILGIFFFNEMLDLGKEICERFFIFWR
jgi:hypothetical protein